MSTILIAGSGSQVVDIALLFAKITHCFLGFFLIFLLSLNALETVENTYEKTKQ